MDLHKNTSQLPEIRLQVVGKVRPQRSCESYDSAASGMSWSSSQSATASGRDHQHHHRQQKALQNSNSLCSNPSSTGYEAVDEDSSNSVYIMHSINSSPGVLCKFPASPQGDTIAGRPAANRSFQSGTSFEEEDEEAESDDGDDDEEEDGGECDKNTFQPEEDEGIQSPPVQYGEDFNAGVFEEYEENKKLSSSANEMRGAPKRKSFKHFWKAAYRVIKTDTTKEPCKVNKEDYEEIDPIYQLLKSAATQRQATQKSPPPPISQTGPSNRPPRLSLSSRTSSVSQKDLPTPGP